MSNPPVYELPTARGPARLVSPGRIIARELEARGWQQKDLAEIMGRPEQAISEIINGKKEITPTTARELAESFGTFAEFWMNLETQYRLRLAQRESEERNIARRAQLYSTVPYRELVKRHWIEDTNDLDEQEKGVCRFLGVATLDEEPPLAMAARHSEHGTPERRAEIAWACRVQQLAEQQVCLPFQRATLEGAISDLLACSIAEEGVARVPGLLHILGIRFVVVSHLPQTYLDGAALYMDDAPVVALTLRYDRLDNFWFTLTHEIAHIVLGHSGVYLDRLDDQDNQTAEERRADAWAQNRILDSEAYASFVRSGKLSNESVAAFAHRQQRHPALVAGRLQHDDPAKYKRYGRFRVSVRHYLADWIDQGEPAKL